MRGAQTLAQDLFDKAVVHVMDLKLTEGVIKTLGCNIALSMLDEIVSRNTNVIFMDLYCETKFILEENDVGF
jgi:hypothetical protein